MYILLVLLLLFLFLLLFLVIGIVLFFIRMIGGFANLRKVFSFFEENNKLRLMMVFHPHKKNHRKEVIPCLTSRQRKK